MQSGQCAKCKKEIVDYEPIILESDSVGYPYTCKCGHYGVEWYDIMYNHST